MRLDLRRMAQENGVRRNKTLRTIKPTQANAQELASIYMRVVRLWQSAIDDIIAGYDPPPLADSLTLDTTTQITSAIDRAQDEATRLVLALGFPLRQWALRIERWQRGKWIGAVKTATSIDLTTIISPDGVSETIEAFLSRNTALITNVSDELRGRVADTVLRNFQARASARDMAREVSQAVGLSRKRALRIASDQNAKLSAALDRDRQQEAGLERFRWQHSGKLHPRDEHVARDGIVYAWDDKRLSERPGELPYCGCRAGAYLDIFDDIDI